MKTPNNPVARAELLLNTPYKHCGRSHKGIDCLGLFFFAYDINEAAYPEALRARERLEKGYYQDGSWKFDRHNPDHLESCRILQQALTKHLLYVKIGQLKPGDALLMSFKTREYELGDHMAIYAGGDRVIHADMRDGVTYRDLENKYWRRVIGAYRKPE